VLPFTPWTRAAAASAWTWGAFGKDHLASRATSDESASASFIRYGHLPTSTRKPKPISDALFQAGVLSKCGVKDGLGQMGQSIERQLTTYFALDPSKKLAELYGDQERCFRRIEAVVRKSRLQNRFFINHTAALNHHCRKGDEHGKRRKHL
jgi:hypothetical protein